MVENYSKTFGVVLFSPSHAEFAPWVSKTGGGARPLLENVQKEADLFRGWLP